MGKNDIAVKQWLSAKDRFADLFNMLILKIWRERQISLFLTRQEGRVG